LIHEELSFQFATTILTTGSEMWNSFTVCNTQGEELVRATPIYAAYAKRPFRAVLDSLFLAVTHPLRSQLRTGHSSGATAAL
jgi:hypothetical protein